jgi:aminoglycoside phosphotransferase family enzyme/predicted kinase
VGEDVFKIKLAVNYSYLDMRSLDVRERLCRRELELNSRQLPEIYRSVVAVTRELDGSLQIDGSGAPVEWALHMKRFDEALVMDRIASSGNLTVELAARTGRALARYHAALEPREVMDGYTRVEEVVLELIHELGLHTDLFGVSRLKEFRKGGVQELHCRRSLIDSRAVSGYVRRCHGDLHLRNMLLWEGAPVPFDALEFDERMATTDVLYDFAFFVMDLQHRGLTAQANQAVSQYCVYSDRKTISGLALLPLFLCCRAAIRAMTTAQAARLSAESSVMLQEEAVEYLDRSLSYLCSVDPVLVATGGLSGTGKSTLSRQMAPELPGVVGALLIRSDMERKVSAGVDENVPLPAASYTPESAHSNYQLMLAKVDMALGAGVSVMVDGTFLQAEERAAIEQCAEAKGVMFKGIWLEAPVDVLQRRVSDRVNDASDATVEIIQKQLDVDTGPVSWQRVNAEGTPAQVFERFRSAVLDAVR